MPPKASSGVGPRRITRTTSRKTAPRVPKSMDVDASPVTPSAAAAAIITSPHLESSSKIEISQPNEVPVVNNPVSTALVESPKSHSGNAPKSTANSASSKSSSEENPAAVTAEAGQKRGEESRGPIAQQQDETLSEKASGTAAAIEAALPENDGESAQDGATMKRGAKTVVKKRVRVVKKVIKKMVPKKAQKGQAVSSNEGSESMEVDHEVLIPNPGVLGSVEVENPDSFEPDSMHVANPNIDLPVSLEAGNPNSDPSPTISMGIGNSISATSDHIDNKEKNSGSGGEQAVSTVEAQLEDQNVGSVGDQKDRIETGNMDTERGKDTDKERTKEEGENCDVRGLKEEVGAADGLILSGEMEALERRKRRKTEVFVGGLHKDASEEDIRKVLQEIGEIAEVRLVRNDKTGKNKGFAFVRYATAADAKKALAKFAQVKICGKQCGIAPVEGNDTIFLGNLDKKWKYEDVLKWLQEIGIEKIDQITVMPDPSKMECNRGFAFLELETSRDAQNAYRILQKKAALGKNQKIKVAWAEPLREPDEEEILKVKSVYAEYLPSSWDEEKVKSYFEKFGEIENVALARNLRSSKRKDFAFVNYTTREAALACIEAFNHESLCDDGSKVNVKVSLAKPMPRGKQVKRVTNPVSKEPPKEKLKAAQALKPVIKLHQPTNKRNPTSSNYGNTLVDRSSTTVELVQLLREQASWKPPQTGSVDLGFSYSSPSRKRPFSVIGDDSFYTDPRGYSRIGLERSSIAASSSSTGLAQGAGSTFVPYYHH
ncbi:uncharacterized protein LOC127806728 [Diospyros lotus]|uniref:uncharacterized protein LOC127806728 n=1 Tax=Diospyros lotus TaxID=55363 RepID=UPI00224EB5E0|nr:uncharacterized protein LOC127806728 [Diospyros lotus]